MFMVQPILRRAAQSLAIAGLFAAGSCFAAAQTSTAPPQAAPLFAPAGLNLSLPVATDSTFSSSSADNAAVVAENHFDFLNLDANAQPARRGYGRPRYRGANTNADGSNKYGFLAGVGFTQPVGNTYHYFVPSYSFQVGAIRNFNKNFGVALQFDWDNFALNQRTLGNESYIFTGDQYPADYGLDAHSHIWSFTLDPTYSVSLHEGLGGYVVGGVGFYHKTTEFTVPQTETEEDIYGDVFQYEANATFPGGDYSSNSVGFNGGLGLTYKFSRFSSERFYGEIRYVVTLNSQRQGITVDNVAANPDYAGSNFFPANTNRTTYIPVKFGIRF